MIRTALTTTVACAFFTPPSNVTPMLASISKCLMPATKWNAKADSSPHATNLAKKLLAKALLTASKPAGDDRDLPNAQKAKIRPTNRMTPVIRCVIDVSAGSGKCIVVRSRFTGRLLFTAIFTLRALWTGLDYRKMHCDTFNDPPQQPLAKPCGSLCRSRSIVT